MINPLGHWLWVLFCNRSQIPLQVLSRFQGIGFPVLPGLVVPALVGRYLSRPAWTCRPDLGTGLPPRPTNGSGRRRIQTEWDPARPLCLWCCWHWESYFWDSQTCWEWVVVRSVPREPQQFRIAWYFPPYLMRHWEEDYEYIPHAKDGNWPFSITRK